MTTREKWIELFDRFPDQCSAFMAAISAVAGQPPTGSRPISEPDGIVGVDGFRLDGTVIDGLPSTQLTLLSLLHRSRGKRVDTAYLTGTNLVWSDLPDPSSVSGYRHRLNDRLRKAGLAWEVVTSGEGRYIALTRTKSTQSA